MQDLEAAIDLALQKSGSPETRRAEISTMLENSAGELGGQPYYRPWYVAAKALQMDLDLQAIDSADDVDFTRQATPIRALLDWQMAIDSNSLAEVPEAFRSESAIASMVGTVLRNPKMGLFIA